MRKIVSKEVTICDNCGKEGYVETCLRCGVEYCWKCRKDLGVEYSHGVDFSGSGDGYYCASCDVYLRQHGGDSLHLAYLEIQKLKREASGFYADFKIRQDEAEAKIKQLNQP